MGVAVAHPFMEHSLLGRSIQLLRFQMRRSSFGVMVFHIRSILLVIVLPLLGLRVIYHMLLPLLRLSCMVPTAVQDSRISSMIHTPGLFSTRRSIPTGQWLVQTMERVLNLAQVQIQILLAAVLALSLITVILY